MVALIWPIAVRAWCPRAHHHEGAHPHADDLPEVWATRRPDEEVHRQVTERVDPAAVVLDALDTVHDAA